MKFKSHRIVIFITLAWGKEQGALLHALCPLRSALRFFFNSDFRIPKSALRLVAFQLRDNIPHHFVGTASDR